MTIFELMKNRRSIRKYKTKGIPLDKVYKILKAGGLAPSGANQQPWTYILIDDMELKMEIRRRAEAEDKRFHDASPEWLKKWFREQNITTKKQFLTDAPILIVVAGNTKAPFWLESTWLSIAYIILTAEEEGLGTLTYTPGDVSFLKSLLNLPEEYHPAVILPMGYPDEKPSPDKRPRKPLEEIAFHNKYGVKLTKLGFKS